MRKNVKKRELRIVKMLKKQQRFQLKSSLKNYKL